MTLSNLLTFIPPCIVCFVISMTFILSERRMKSNKEIEFSRPLYKEYLLKTLPQALSNYTIDTSNKTYSESLSTTLKEFRSDIKYFNYSHKKIYEEVVEAISSMEYAIVKNTEPPEKLSSSIEISESFHQIYKAFLFDLPDDHIDSYFRLK